MGTGIGRDGGQRERPGGIDRVDLGAASRRGPGEVGLGDVATGTEGVGQIPFRQFRDLVAAHRPHHLVAAGQGAVGQDDDVGRRGGDRAAAGGEHQQRAGQQPRAVHSGRMEAVIPVGPISRMPTDARGQTRRCRITWSQLHSNQPGRRPSRRRASSGVTW